MIIKIDEEKCTGCGICANICPEGIEMVGGKAKIKDENAECLKDATNSCPRGAIILDGNNLEKSNEDSNINQGFGQRRGIGKGQGRGLGMGPRDGKGMGQGGGGRGMGQGRGRRKW